MSDMLEAEFENITLDQDGPIGILTINRPKSLNALNIDTFREIAEAIMLIEENPEVEALIVTGAGDKAFVAGADITEIADLEGAFNGRDLSLQGQDIFQQIAQLPFLTIAAVNGYALGGGLELAMACDLRIASPNAKLGLPEATLGLLPGYGGTQRLPRLVGVGRALDIMVSARLVDAKEARDIGLVNEVVDQPLERAKEYAQNVLSKTAPLAVGLIKEAVRRGMDTTFADALEIEADLFGMAVATEDRKEGTKAFLEKRKPQFKGE